MNETTSFRIGSKDILARVMATEDITVQHDAQAETAYFDVKSRTLCLPVWKDMDSSMYDMLVGHEVSHALHTPSDGWMDWIGDGPDAMIRKMALNIVEDARIERLIKDKFPGLRRDFAKSYKTLHDNDTLGIKGTNIADLPLIDRLNIHFKMGLFGYVDVPFTDEEKPFVKQMASIESFDEVLELAETLVGKQQQEQQQEQQQAQASTNEGDETSMVQESGEGDNAQQDDENVDENGNAELSDEANTLDDLSYDAYSNETYTPDDLSYDAYSNETCTPGQTQHNFEQSMKDLKDEDAGEHVYHTLAKPVLENIIVPFQTVEKIWNTHNEKRPLKDHQVEIHTEAVNDLTAFQREITPTVNHMVQVFQMKQAADADKRTEVAKTGVLDCIKMIDYRWSEDIFLKNETHADGKNHGIVMFLDWSGSMGGIIEDTVKQLLILVEFCRKVGIPYDVYSFSSMCYSENVDEYGYPQFDSNTQWWTQERDSDINPHPFSLFQLLSSDMNSTQHKVAIKNLWILSRSMCYSYDRRLPCPQSLEMGSTPLNEAIICALDMVPQFQKKHSVQICNTVFLTDGEGHSVGLGFRGYQRHNSKSFLRDSKTRAVYSVGSGYTGETGTLLQLLKDRTGATIIGIRLHDSRSINNYVRYRLRNTTEEQFKAMDSQFKKMKFVTVDTDGYDEMFLVQGNVKVQTDAMEGLDEDASFTKIKNAFMRGNNTKKASRVIAGRIVDLIA
tara:strand:- start:92 stop:2281 length:2190 start_codon:yes stop_codon:yes gene_type:complete